MPGLINKADEQAQSPHQAHGKMQPIGPLQGRNARGGQHGKLGLCGDARFLYYN